MLVVIEIYHLLYCNAAKLHIHDRTARIKQKRRANAKVSRTCHGGRAMLKLELGLKMELKMELKGSALQTVAVAYL